MAHRTYNIEHEDMVQEMRIGVLEALAYYMKNHDLCEEDITDEILKSKPLGKFIKQRLFHRRVTIIRKVAAVHEREKSNISILTSEGNVGRASKINLIADQIPDKRAYNHKDISLVYEQFNSVMSRASDRQKLILSLIIKDEKAIKCNGTLNVLRIAEKLGENPATIERQLHKLRVKGYDFIKLENTNATSKY